MLAVNDVVLFGGLSRLGASTHTDVTRRPTAEVWCQRVYRLFKLNRIAQAGMTSKLN